MRNINLIGYASGIAANDIDTSLGPLYLQQHTELFLKFNIMGHWKGLVYGLPSDSVASVIRKLSDEVNNAIVQPDSQLVVFGGDHSMGIATWHTVMHHNPSLGLIWVDAHLDAHTPDSSHSKNIHGMPIAHLLGLWRSPIVDLSFPYVYLNPQNICIIGARSYELEEYEALKKIGVRIYFMDEVHQRGISTVFREARVYLESRTKIQGLSIDLDAFDPKEIPGVGCPEANGIDPGEFLHVLQNYYWPIIEIAEYNPIRDTSARTADFVLKMLDTLVK